MSTTKNDGLWQAKKDAEASANSKGTKAKSGNSAAATAVEEETSKKPFDIHFVQFKGNRFRIREFDVSATVAEVKKEVRRTCSSLDCVAA